MNGNLHTATMVDMVAHLTVHKMEVILSATKDMAGMGITTMDMGMGMDTAMDMVTAMATAMDLKWIITHNTAILTRSIFSRSDGLVTIAALLPSLLSRKHVPTRKLAQIGTE